MLDEILNHVFFFFRNIKESSLFINMKPPKAFRGVVNTLFGINKKPGRDTAASASVPARRQSFDDMEIIDRRRAMSHREEFTLPPQQTSTLPRRTKSYGSEVAASIHQEPIDHRSEARFVSQQRPQPIQFENHKRVSNDSEFNRAMSLPASRSSFPEQIFNRRTVSTSSAQEHSRNRSQEQILSDYDEKIHFTNSSASSKPISQVCKNQQPPLKEPREINNNEIKPICHNGSNPQESKDKLVSCLDALDRLSQQVKRINQVSEKVKRVEKYSQHNPQKVNIFNHFTD